MLYEDGHQVLCKLVEFMQLECLKQKWDKANSTAISNFYNFLQINL